MLKRDCPPCWVFNLQHTPVATAASERGEARLESQCTCVCCCTSVRLGYRPLSNARISRWATDGDVMVLPFHPHHKSGYNGGFVLQRNRINMKEIALESKSNQAGSHSDENELIRKATCLLKGREIKTEGGGGGEEVPGVCGLLLPNLTSALLHPTAKNNNGK